MAKRGEKAENVVRDPDSGGEKIDTLSMATGKRLSFLKLGFFEGNLMMRIEEYFFFGYKFE